MSTRTSTTLDRDLTIRSVSPRGHEAVGRSAFVFVLPSHHDFLDAVYRELFDRRRMVSYEVPAVGVDDSRPRWWFVRAAPLCMANRAVAALAHALPGDYVASSDWQAADADAWERELALHELMPILRGFNADLISGLAPRSSAPRRPAWARASGAARRASLHLCPRPDRAR